ncbi:uncharacterized protein VTP21DRAFT_10112 [Calcarisporiella thermophila]|uniref:uncharacterized protein n=1 Tax=Calcarisporiella thermophila TaxID=911321 RepID=UPI0037440B69
MLYKEDAFNDFGAFLVANSHAQPTAHLSQRYEIPDKAPDHPPLHSAVSSVWKCPEKSSTYLQHSGMLMDTLFLQRAFGDHQKISTQVNLTSSGFDTRAIPACSVSPASINIPTSYIPSPDSPVSLPPSPLGRRPADPMKLFSKRRRPPYSYKSLIIQAIESSPRKSMTVSEIYEYILKHYPYFRTAQCLWRNSIRYNLTMKKEFVREPRPEDEPGKGGKWCLNYAVRSECETKKSIKEHPSASFQILPSLTTAAETATQQPYNSKDLSGRDLFYSYYGSGHVCG